MFGKNTLHSDLMVLCTVSNGEVFCIFTPLLTHTENMWGFPLLADGNKKHKTICIGVNYVAKAADES